MDPRSKAALVTGAGVRVGRAIAMELARAGCNVAIHYRRSKAAAEDLAEEISGLGCRATVVSGELASPAVPDQLVQQTVSALGGLDILVNNASEFARLEFDSTDAQRWEQCVQVNLIAPALLARAAAPHLRRSGSGRIINMCDILSDRPPRGYAAYCTSKAGLAALTRCLAVELAPEVTVNAIAPGIAEFPDSYDQATRDRLVSRVPLQRAGTPGDVAGLVRFLVEHGDYITGQVIPLDGGRSIRL